MKPLKYIVPDSDLRWDTFRAGGNGGQNQNKRDTGARVTHIPSGISAEAREERSQLQNKKVALQKLAENKLFKAWCAAQLSALEQGYKSVEDKVNKMMDESNLKVECECKCCPNEFYCDKVKK